MSARDPGMALLRALLRTAPRASALDLGEMTSTAWASATFTGARHVIHLTARDDAALAGWLARLPDTEVHVCGHLLVDLHVASITRIGGMAGVRIAALTVEEA